MKRSVVGALVLLAVLGLLKFIAHVDGLNQVTGGTMVSLSVTLMPLFAVFLHLKDLLLTDEMEGLVVGFVGPRVAPPTNDEAHLASLVDVPDYDNRELAWNLLPGMDGTGTLVPPTCGTEPCSPEAQGAAKVDMFFVGPSTHYSPLQWNSDWRDGMTRYMNREAIAPQQANVFNHVARVYFPQIRQMSGLGYLVPNSTSALRASEIAYSDVRRAFLYYLERYNADRPFMVAGHSQGAEYLLRLLREEIAPRPELKRKLVVAYLVGMPVYRHVLEEMNLPACESRTSTGCVVSWQTYVEGAHPKHFYFEPLHHALRFNGQGGEEAKYAARTCVNPLSWTLGKEEYVARTHNKGAMHLVQYAQNIQFLLSWTISSSFRDRQKARMNQLLPLKPHVVGARCVNGSLWVDSPPLGELDAHPTYAVFPVWRFAMFPGSNLHPYDFNLFWANIRDNAADRTKAYLQ